MMIAADDNISLLQLFVTAAITIIEAVIIASVAAMNTIHLLIANDAIYCKYMLACARSGCRTVNGYNNDPLSQRKQDLSYPVYLTFKKLLLLLLTIVVVVVNN